VRKGTIGWRRAGTVKDKERSLDEPARNTTAIRMREKEGTPP
jgi:hypothetical protein